MATVHDCTRYKLQYNTVAVSEQLSSAAVTFCDIHRPTHAYIARHLLVPGACLSVTSRYFIELVKNVLT